MTDGTTLPGAALTILRAYFVSGCPIPADSKIVVRKGKRLAQWTNRSGKVKTAELNEAGDRIRCETGTYIAKFRDGDGVVCEVSTGCRDKQAANEKCRQVFTTVSFKFGFLLVTGLPVNAFTASGPQ